jgi:hypothetical protein
MSTDESGQVGEPVDPPPAGADPSAAEQELLAAFDRLRPQGSIRWAFEDALRRVDQPDIDSSAGAHPWRGLPDDLWDRGRSAQVGRRLVGEVATVMADLLAADARAAADAAVTAVNGDRFVATWDAFQYLAARVEALERRVDPLGLEAAEWPGPPPDQRAWADVVARWFTGPGAERSSEGARANDGERAVVVGESGDGTLARALQAAGRTVRAVDPRGAEMWKAFGDGVAPVSVVLDHVEDHLRSLPDRTVSGVVLIGCVDRADLAGKLSLADEAIRVTASGGTVAVLTTDQHAWEASLPAPARDLASGRPFHPETWMLILARLGAVEPEWLRAPSGIVEAVVARVER